MLECNLKIKNNITEVSIQKGFFSKALKLSPTFNLDILIDWNSLYNPS